MRVSALATVILLSTGAFAFAQPASNNGGAAAAGGSNGAGSAGGVNSSENPPARTGDPKAAPDRAVAAPSTGEGSMVGAGANR